MENNSNTVQLKDIDVTMAHVLKHAGYDTALFGKYSIGSQMGVTDPLAMGFDTWYGMYSILEGHRQYPKFLWKDGRQLRIEANEGVNKGAYAQELFTQEAIDYIKLEHKKNTARSMNRFFLLSLTRECRPERPVTSTRGITLNGSKTRTQLLREW